jgi:hypothetical protein
MVSASPASRHASLHHLGFEAIEAAAEGDDSSMAGRKATLKRARLPIAIVIANSSPNRAAAMLELGRAGHQHV